MTEVTFGTYETIAPEYYDPVRHPTCANFRDASLSILRPWLTERDWRQRVLCDLGAGRSVVAEILARGKDRPRRLCLLDRSPSMVAQTPASTLPVVTVIGDARALALRDHCLDLAVASLGDPFNDLAFWSEMARVLKPGGLVAFTTPSYEWARSFRAETPRQLLDSATFIVRGGERVETPSFVLPRHAQSALLRSVGLELETESVVILSELQPAQISPKLRIDGPDLPVVHGYLARKTRVTR